MRNLKYYLGTQIYYTSVPVILCNKDHKIIYKNKSAYYHKLPRLLSDVRKSLEDGDVSKINKLSSRECVVVEMKNADDLRLCGVVSAHKAPNGSYLIVFSTSLTLGNNQESLKHLCDYILELKDGFCLCRCDEREHTRCLKESMLRAKCLSLSLKEPQHFAAKEMSLEGLVFVLEKYLTQILKRIGSSVRVRLCAEDGASSMHSCYIADPEPFLSAFMFLFTFIQSLKKKKQFDICFFIRGDKAVFEFSLEELKDFSEKTNHILDVREHFPFLEVEMKIFDELLSSYGWDFEISESVNKGNYATVRMSVKTHKISRYLQSEGYVSSTSQAFAHFVSFVYGRNGLKKSNKTKS